MVPYYLLQLIHDLREQTFQIVKPWSINLVIIISATICQILLFFSIIFMFFSLADDHDELINDSPIEQVRLTVPITDDPTLPCLTFRTWFLGIVSCAVLAFLNQFFGYRQNTLYISSVSAQIVVLPIGILMAAKLPKRSIRIPATSWSFSLNPGPFNLKEHVLITIFANSGSNGVYAVNIITIIKAFYIRDIHPVAAMLLAQTTQVVTELKNH